MRLYFLDGFSVCFLLLFPLSLLSLRFLCFRFLRFSSPQYLKVEVVFGQNFVLRVTLKRETESSS